MGRKPFARELQKQTAGEYALLNMSLEPSKVVELHTALKHNEEIFRIQVSKLAAEAAAAPEPAAASEDA